MRSAHFRDGSIEAGKNHAKRDELLCRLHFQEPHALTESMHGLITCVFLYTQLRKNSSPCVLQAIFALICETSAISSASALCVSTTQRRKRILVHFPPSHAHLGVHRGKCTRLIVGALASVIRQSRMLLAVGLLPSSSETMACQTVPLLRYAK